MKLREFTDDPPKQNVLLYGPPKTGKTMAAASAPGPLLMFNLDLPNATIGARRVNSEIMEVDRSGSDMPVFKAMKEIETLLNTGDERIGKLETIVVDPVGELYRLVLEELSDNAISPSLPTYQAAGAHVERFLRALCTSEQVNAVFVGHEFPVQDEATGEVEKLLWTGTKSNSQSMSQKLLGMVDIVGYTAVIEEKGETKYVAQLVNGKGRRGGDRFDVLREGSIFREMNLTEWFQTARGETTTNKETKE